MSKKQPEKEKNKPVKNKSLFNKLRSKAYTADWKNSSNLLQNDIDEYKIMCKATDISFTGKYINYTQLLKESGLTENEFFTRCTNLYSVLQSEQWDPSIEMCGLCIVMKDKFNKIWFDVEKKWVKK